MNVGAPRTFVNSSRRVLRGYAPGGSHTAAHAILPPVRATQISPNGVASANAGAHEREQRLALRDRVGEEVVEERIVVERAGERADHCGALAGLHPADIERSGRHRGERTLDRCPTMTRPVRATGSGLRPRAAVAADVDPRGVPGRVAVLTAAGRP